MDDRDDLERTLDELAGTLDELRDEVGEEQPTGGTRDLLRFTEQYTIPAVIAILETNIRLLELLAGSIGLADGRLDEGKERSAARTLDALDGTLTDVREAVEGTPGNPEARRLLRDARELRSEAERRLEERTTTARGYGGADEGDDAVHEVPVDVEAELESIKREVDDDASDGSPKSAGNDSSDGADGASDR